MSIDARYRRLRRVNAIIEPFSMKLAQHRPWKCLQRRVSLHGIPASGEMRKVAAVLRAAAMHPRRPITLRWPTVH